QTAKRPNVYTIAANVRFGPEAEAKLPSPEPIQIVVLADDQTFAGPGAKHREHRRNLRHLLVIALQIENDADRRRVPHQRAVTLIGLHDEKVGAAGESVA